MLALIIILAWLLINTWLTLLICFANGDMLSEWDELGMIAICAVISPFTILALKSIIYKIKKYKVIKRRRKNEDSN